MAKDNLIADVISQAPNRRGMLKSLGIATAAATVLGTGAKINAQGSTTPSAVDILQFALNLEYLEAEFYTYAVTGNGIEAAGIDVSGTGKSGPTTGGKAVSFANNYVFTGQIAAQIMVDEQDHVKLLRDALMGAGVTPIAKAPINLNALGIGFANELQFLTLARAFEDVGVTAYAGGAQVSSLQMSPYIGVAARILATEALHAGNVRLQVARLGIKTMQLDPADIIPPPSGTQFFAADTCDGLVEIRTPGQVLFIVYGGKPNATSGGFFPMGVNGNLNTSSSSPATLAPSLVPGCTPTAA